MGSGHGLQDPPPSRCLPRVPTIACLWRVTHRDVLSPSLAANSRVPFSMPHLTSPAEGQGPGVLSPSPTSARAPLARPGGGLRSKPLPTHDVREESQGGGEGSLGEGLSPAAVGVLPLTCPRVHVEGTNVH